MRRRASAGNSIFARSGQVSRIGYPVIDDSISLNGGFPRLDYTYANEAFTRKLPDDLILVGDFAEGELAFRRHDDEIPSRVDGNQSIVANRDGGETPDLAVVGFLAPCFRKARIALKIESVAVAADRDDDLRSIGLPFRGKPRIGEPSAQKSAASARAIRICAAPLAAHAVGTPRAPRLVDFRDTHDLAAQGAAAARPPRQRFCRSGNLIHQRA